MFNFVHIVSGLASRQPSAAVSGAVRVAARRVAVARAAGAHRARARPERAAHHAVAQHVNGTTLITYK